MSNMRTHLESLWEKRQESANRVRVNVPPGIFIDHFWEDHLPKNRRASMWFIGSEFKLFWLDGSADDYVVTLDPKHVNMEKILEMTVVSM